MRVTWNLIEIWPQEIGYNVAVSNASPSEGKANSELLC
jgi:hypothetical protein